MMLRASSQATERRFDLRAVIEDGGSGSGVPHGDLLLAFTDAVVARDRATMATLRSEIRQLLGDRALVDISGVIANFHRMTRIADGTGIPLDEVMLEKTADLREDLGLDSYPSAANTLD